MGAKITSKSNEGGTISYDCAWCRRNSMAQLVLQQQIHQHDLALTVYLLGRCSHADCGAPSLFVGTFAGSGGAFWGAFSPSAVVGRELRTIPAVRAEYNVPEVPDRVRAAMTEAYGCEAEGFLLGAAVVGRRALQLAVRNKGGKGPTLQAEIASLPDDVLSARLKKAANHVRLIGNDAAHDDTGVTSDDVTRLFLFTNATLQELFVLPLEIDAATGARPLPPRRGG